MLLLLLLLLIETLSTGCSGQEILSPPQVLFCSLEGVNSAQTRLLQSLQKTTLQSINKTNVGSEAFTRRAADNQAQMNSSTEEAAGAANTKSMSQVKQPALMTWK